MDGYRIGEALVSVLLLTICALGALVTLKECIGHG